MLASIRIIYYTVKFRNHLICCQIRYLGNILITVVQVTADAVFYELPFEQTLVTHAAESISGNVSLQECGVQCNEAGGNCSSFEWDGEHFLRQSRTIFQQSDNKLYFSI